MEPSGFDFARYLPDYMRSNHSHTVGPYSEADIGLVQVMMSAGRQGGKTALQAEMLEAMRNAKKENPQAVIDKAVKEALEKPAIEAEEARQQSEIERRVAMVETIGYEDKHEIGTVLKFERRLGKDTDFSQSKVYSYAAMKAGDGNWYLTGQHQSKAGGWRWKVLIEWMVTGDHTVENLQVATAWETIV